MEAATCEKACPVTCSRCSRTHSIHFVPHNNAGHIQAVARAGSWFKNLEFQIIGTINTPQTGIRVIWMVDPMHGNTVDGDA
jgi:3-deoxy-D-arabino-heptulosonate 7-phosphate (DAHP) synthase class II